MNDTPQSKATDGLEVFTVEVKFHVINNPDKFRVYARSLDDAKEIARRLFWETRTNNCVVEDICEVQSD